MAADFKYCMKEYPVACFFMLSILFTWTAWIPHTAYISQLFPVNYTLSFILGGLGPLFAAYVMLLASYGKQQTEEQFGQMLTKWRLPLSWYGGIALIAFLLELPAIMTLESKQLFNGETTLKGILLTAAAGLFLAATQEMAWRGFVLPRVQKKHNALLSSLIVGAMSAIWHPGFIGGIVGIQDHIHPIIDLTIAIPENMLLPWFIDILAKSVIYTWIYNSTKGSVFLLIVLHMLTLTFGTFMGWPSALMSTAVAVSLIIAYKPETLSANRQKYTLLGSRKVFDWF